MSRLSESVTRVMHILDGADLGADQRVLEGGTAAGLAQRAGILVVRLGMSQT
ncbi:hypothetical protein ACFWAA_28940 [Streptomyces sp. NPDC059922]|uniref:hypothetical protein n=1 Tax=Streptomyces sp. NPDC059922 TaxID=3347005 RepID=UPI0036689659